MNEAVTKRFLLYFRLMLLVWILIVNSILHVVGFEYSWLIFLSNIMLFTMEGDIKDRFVSVELGGLVGRAGDRSDGSPAEPAGWQLFHRKLVRGRRLLSRRRHA